MAAGDTVAIVGSGGREYELARAIADSEQVGQVFVLPGNAGTDQISKVSNRPIKSSDLDSIVAFVDEGGIDLTVVGPEAPLVAGLADQLRARGHEVFGPDQEVARLESSKIFADEFVEAAGIPHPRRLGVAYTHEDASAVIGQTPTNRLVLKADGLAGGKGVNVPKTRKEAYRFAGKVTSGKVTVDPNDKGLLIQERHHGPEVSKMVILKNGERASLPLSQDHKRRDEGDTGPMTGGIGAYSPVPEAIVSREQEEKIEIIVDKFVAELQRRGLSYDGCIYLGLMLAEELHGEPVVLEFNIRFGDPETQAQLETVLDDGVDFYELLRNPGNTSERELLRRAGSVAVTVCLMSEGYPDKSELGLHVPIHGLDTEHMGVVVQHGNTAKGDDGSIRVAGGRALYVTGVDNNIRRSQKKAYGAIDMDQVGEESGKIGFEGMRVRPDIARQAILLA